MKIPVISPVFFTAIITLNSVQEMPTTNTVLADDVPVLSLL